MFGSINKFNRGYKMILKFLNVSIYQGAYFYKEKIHFIGSLISQSCAVKIENA